jgi:Fe-S oxidoreductase
MAKQQSIGAVMADMTARCTSCGDCVRPCAFLQRQGTPAAIAGRGATTEKLLAAYGCSLCGLCDGVCPEGLSPSYLFLAMRQQSAEKGLVDLKPYKPWLKYERMASNILFQRDLIPPGCTTVFFPGCSLPGTRPEAVKKLYSRLRQQDQSIGLVLDCCGKISHDLGLREQFETVFNKLHNRLQRYGVTRILTACPGCSKILRNNSNGLEVISVYEHLLLSLPPEALLQDRQHTVVIHDPCPSRFDAAQQQAVRKLLLGSGWQVEELPFNGSSTRCCGQGGMVEGCVPGTVTKEAGIIAAAAAGRSLVSSCGACCETLSATTPTAHIADLVTGTGGFATHQVSSLKRWLNRMKLRFSRLS